MTTPQVEDLAVELALCARLPGDLRLLLPLPAEGTVLIGREAPANLVLQDGFLSRSHLSLTCSRGLVTLTDAGSRNGTFLNGVRIKQASLRQGDALFAGQSFLRLTALINNQHAATPETRPAWPLLTAAPSGLKPLHLHLLKRMNGPLPFAVLDGASDPAVLDFLQSSGTFFQSLYEGEHAAPIAPSGPFLIDLRGAPHLLPCLIERGWGKTWGLFLYTAQSFEQLRRHLRTQLTLEDDAGRKQLFRFYDPRILQTFLATAPPDRRREFFGEIEGMLLETESPEELFLLSASGEKRFRLMD